MMTSSHPAACCGSPRAPQAAVCGARPGSPAGASGSCCRSAWAALPRRGSPAPRPLDGLEAGKQSANWRNWSPLGLSFNSGKFIRYLLQAKHIEIGHGAAWSTMRAGSSTPSAPRHHCTFHVMSSWATPARMVQRIPARMKLCTNWRWKMRKRSATAPRSSAWPHKSLPIHALIGRRENLQADRSGRDSTEFVMINGHSEVVPLVADRDEAVGDIGGAGERQHRPSSAPEAGWHPPRAPRHRVLLALS